MTGVLSGLGWLLVIAGGLTAISLFPRWAKWAAHYYDEPTLLDAPHAAEQARQARADASAGQQSNGGRA